MVIFIESKSLFLNQNHIVLINGIQVLYKNLKELHGYGGMKEMLQETILKTILMVLVKYYHVQSQFIIETYENLNLF